MSWMSELDGARAEARLALGKWGDALDGTDHSAEYRAALEMASALRGFLNITDQIAQADRYDDRGYLVMGEISLETERPPATGGDDSARAE